MSDQLFFTPRLSLTALVSVALGGLLAWDYSHGGVPRHHLLANPALPSVSNWWGALLLPVLTWWLLARVQHNAMGNAEASATALPSFRRAWYGFTGAVVVGALIAVLFTLGYPDLAGNVLLGLFIGALFVPIHRPECLLGFVLSMSFTFGPVLPLLIGTLVGLIGLVLYAGLRPAMGYVGSKAMRMASSNQPPKP
jgi:hypothetical protein